MIELIFVLLLIIMNGAFAMGEMAIVSARRARLKQMAANGNRGARRALILGEDQARFLSTIQIGITLVNVLSSVLGGAQLTGMLVQWLEQWPFLAEYAQLIAFSVVVCGLSYMSLVIGELVPKQIALENPEYISARMAPVLNILATAARPLGWFLSLSTRLLLYFVPRGQRLPTVTDDEIRILMQEGTEIGQFHEKERDIVGMALRLGDRRVSALMTPRTQMQMLDLQDCEAEIRQQLLTAHYSRYPVIDGDVTKLVGILEVKEIAARTIRGQSLDLAPETLKMLAKPAIFIPDTAPALKALERFKQSGDQIALIVDEYGDLQGMVTLTDILEALVGDITDPNQGQEPAAIMRADGSWLVDGLLPIDELTDHVKLPPLAASDDYQTLGGFIMAQLKRIPTETDVVMVEGFRLEVVDMDGRRVDKVLIVPPRS